MGLLRSYRAAMNEIFATACVRDRVERRMAAELREKMDKALTMCVDLFAWAPFWAETPPTNPAGAWREMQQRRDPFFYVIPLINEAVPVVRDPILCEIRNMTECSICVLHRELLGSEVGLARQGEYTATQHGGAFCRGGALMRGPPPGTLPRGRERCPDAIPEWDTRYQPEPTWIRCDGPCGQRLQAHVGVFRDRRMRVTDPMLRVRMWNMGDAEGTWHCGLCLLKSLQEERVFVQTPPEAIARVKDGNLTVPSDPGAPPEEDPINRSLLTAPAGMDLSETTPLDMLLVDPKVHPSFDPALTKQKNPRKMRDNRFGPNGRTHRIKHVCDGCGNHRFITLTKT